MRLVLTYPLISLIVIERVVESFHDARLVPLLVVPQADETIYEAQDGAYD